MEEIEGAWGFESSGGSFSGSSEALWAVHALPQRRLRVCFTGHGGLSGLNLRGGSCRLD